MNKYVLAALLCPVLGTSFNAMAQDSPRDIMVGAYQAAPTDLDVVQQARRFVQSHMGAMGLGQVIEAYTQVVAGLNVKIVCPVTADEGSATFQFVAFRSLDGVWHFTSATKL